MSERPAVFFAGDAVGTIGADSEHGRAVSSGRCGTPHAHSVTVVGNSCATCGGELPVREHGSGRQRVWCDACMRERRRSQKAGRSVQSAPAPAPKPKRSAQPKRNERLAAIRAINTARQRRAFGLPA